MNLRQVVRVIIQEIANEDLRELIREVIVEELMGDPPRVAAAKKAAATRKARLEGTAPLAETPRKKLPSKRARVFGVDIGNQYRGKKAYPKIRHRTIEVVRCDDRYIYPKIIASAGKNAKAKRISYETLANHYERVRH